VGRLGAVGDEWSSQLAPAATSAMNAALCMVFRTLVMTRTVSRRARKSRVTTRNPDLSEPRGLYGSRRGATACNRQKVLRGWGGVCLG